MQCYLFLPFALQSYHSYHLYVPYSFGRTLNTTGTLVHGSIAISVTTAVIRSEVVTSYRRLSGVK